MRYGHRNPSTAPTVEPTAQDVVWAAGFYEGEGTCRYGSTERVTIVQKQRWPLDWLRERFGGRVRLRKTVYRWEFTGVCAREFLVAIVSLLSPLRQAQVWRCLWHVRATNRKGVAQ